MIRRSTWIVLLLFLALLAGTLLWQKYKPAEPEPTPTAETGRLFEIKPEELVSFEVKNLTGKVVSAKNDPSGNWALDGYSAAETDANQIRNVLQQLSNLTILSLLEQAPDADLVGLVEPAYVVNIILQDGSQKTAYIGSQTPTGGGYYARLEGGKIVVVTKYTVDSLLGILDSPPLVPTPIPTESVTLSPESAFTPTPTP